MKTKTFQRKARLILILLIIALGTVSCTREMEAGPRAWIDFPRKGATVSLGKPISIVSHAFAQEGIAEIMLSINGEAYRRDAPTEAGVTFTEFSQEWTPTEAGVYTLQVRVYDTTGAVSNPATVSVRVAENADAEPSEPDQQEEQEEQEVPETPTNTPTPEISITPTLETPEAACPPVAAALSGANCRTGPSPDYPVVASLAKGQEATVVGRNADSSWWVLEYPSAAATCWVWGDIVALNTDSCDVPLVDAPPLPPTDTPTPTFTPTTPAPDTTPPSAPSPQSPSHDAAIACTAEATLTWSAVNDESGIATYFVKLEKQLSADNWQSAGGYTSSTTQVDVSVQCGIIYRWAVRAEDGAGNVSEWSSFSQFGVELK